MDTGREHKCHSGRPCSRAVFVTRSASRK